MNQILKSFILSSMMVTAQGVDAQERLVDKVFKKKDGSELQMDGPLSIVMDYAGPGTMKKLSWTSHKTGFQLQNDIGMQRIKDDNRVACAYGPKNKRVEAIFVHDISAYMHASGIHSRKNGQSKSWPNTDQFHCNATFSDEYDQPRTTGLRLNKALQPVLTKVVCQGNWEIFRIDGGLMTDAGPYDAPPIQHFCLVSSHHNPAVDIQNWSYRNPSLNTQDADPTSAILGEPFTRESTGTLKQYLDRLTTLEKATVPISTLTNADVLDMKQTWHIKESDNHYTMNKKSDQEIQDQKNAEIQDQKKICDEWAGMLDDVEQRQE